MIWQGGKGKRLWPHAGLLLALLIAAGACDKSKTKERTAPDPTPSVQCTSAAECAADNPCAQAACRNGQCAFQPRAKGHDCENDTLCDGISSCDGTGRCVTGPAPNADDGNACTEDVCDALRGVLHRPINVDDQDACTEDACDPQTGKITHSPVAIDDSDDCTFDSCDPAQGVKHDRIQSVYSCEASCGAGFHAVSKRPNLQCGSREALQTFCAPDCGVSFHSCEASCPKGYRLVSTNQNPQCGARNATQIFCMKD